MGARLCCCQTGPHIDVRTRAKGREKRDAAAEARRKTKRALMTQLLPPKNRHLPASTRHKKSVAMVSPFCRHMVFPISEATPFGLRLSIRNFDRRRHVQLPLWQMVRFATHQQQDVISSFCPAAADHETALHCHPTDPPAARSQSVSSASDYLRRP